MSLLDAEDRAAIHRLCFIERRRLAVIDAELRLYRSTVRRALVIDGGAARSPVPGPYHRSDS